MLILLSPSKKLDFDTSVDFPSTQPRFLERSKELVSLLKKLPKEEISSLMKLSHKLTELNVDRYQSFSTPFTDDNAKQALFAFKGDVYDGLDAPSFNEKDVSYANSHLRILSGLYGVLRPLDLMQPYRLEMGTKLENQAGKNLYAFWQDTLTSCINEDLKQQGDNVIINLASNEYSRSVKFNTLKVDVITPAFKEYRDGTYKMLMLYAKQARGMMARYLIKHRINTLDDTKKFDSDGYCYNEKLSNDNEWVFTR